ncbi:hypothetical protein NM208_g1773 [Fusarium decemcellulare]|uniref:Uncharacterized protein n=1 Tax=Fusarium decemcellulare TaxID=57161 RepID=A0ACC1SV32_9HYPO|nr:hypothetical protein NM208_g1773 [Fusarium decemcellulare]
MAPPRFQTPMHITHITTATVILEIGGVTFITDPVFSEAPAEYDDGPVLKLHNLPIFDAVLLSHETHIDNLNFQGRRLLDGRRVITTLERAKNLAPSPGVASIKPWETLALPFHGSNWDITEVLCTHLPGSEVTGFILRTQAFGMSPDGLSKRRLLYRRYGANASACVDQPEIVVAIMKLGDARIPLPGWDGPLQITMGGKDALGTELRKFFEEEGISNKICWLEPGQNKRGYRPRALVPRPFTRSLFLSPITITAAMDLTSGIKRTRRACRRTKSGCLPCRRRRKKCDEIRPECSGCLRNQLICAWPFRDPATSAIHSDATMIGGNPSPIPQFQTEIRPSTNHTTHVLAAQLSSLPPAFRGVEAASLLDSFTELTAPRMVGKGDIENPFITYNILVSMESTALQHAILAVSSCHRAYSEPSFSLSSRDHYAVALRSLKVGITKWKTCSIQDRIALLASCLTLCWYEVIDADIRGPLYYHLRASGSMISDLRRDERCRDENLLGFFSEQYCYLAIVANIGIGQASSDRLLDPRSLPQPLHALNQNSPIYGFMFGCSHGLFELIPRIARLSSRHRAQKDDSIAIQKEYDCVLSGINSWIPNSQSDDPGYRVAGEMYRAACLVFLHTTMKGHEDLGDELYNEVEPSIALFLRNFKQLSGETPPWTTFMWPTLVVGSCMREESQRKTLLQVLGSSRLRMQTVDSTAHWLSLHWERMDKDAQSYGIDGLEKTMKHQGLDPCVG